MSHVKAGGSSKNIHNNAGARLGVKRFGGQKVNTGEVLVRQTGSTKVAGPGTFLSKNYTIHAAQDSKRSKKAALLAELTFVPKLLFRNHLDYSQLK